MLPLKMLLNDFVPGGGGGGGGGWGHSLIWPIRRCAAGQGT